MLGLLTSCNNISTGNNNNGIIENSKLGEISETLSGVSHEEMLLEMLNDGWAEEFGQKELVIGDTIYTYQIQDLFHIYDDFDGDGRNELFAAITDIGTGYWFANEKGAVLLLHSINGFEAANIAVTNVHDKKFASFLWNDGNGYINYFYGVKDEKPYDTSISQKGGRQADHFAVNIRGELEIIDNRLEGNSRREGRVFKPYFFYLDGDDFKEYGGTEITYEQLCKQYGATDILNKQIPENSKITTIYHRENGIINVNYVIPFGEEWYPEEGYDNYYITLWHDGNKLVLESGERNYGIYMAALLPEIATYPTTYTN